MEWFQLIKYLQNESSPEEKIEVENWIKNSEENRKLFLQIEEMWKSAEKAPDAINPDYQKAWNNISSKTGINERKVKTFSLGRTSPLMKIAASLLIIIALGTFIKLAFLSEPSKLAVSTMDGTKKEIRLTDGTIIALNTKSKLVYPSAFKNKTREVEIEGEAFFKVAKDSKHPFIVHASGTNIKVLGTSFNIKIKGNEQVAVSVLSGKVAFQPENNNSKAVYLTKGEKAVYNKPSTDMVISKENDINFLAWQTGKLIFNSTRLDSAAAAISAHYNRKVVVAPEISNLRITVIFDHQKFEDVIKIITLTMYNINAEYRSDGVYLIQKK